MSARRRICPVHELGHDADQPCPYCEHDERERAADTERPPPSASDDDIRQRGLLRKQGCQR